MELNDAERNPTGKVEEDVRKLIANSTERSDAIHIDSCRRKLDAI